MFLYLYAQEHGWKEAGKKWINRFKKSGKFRRIFVLAFCIIMIMMRTLFNRNMWLNPLSKIMEGWTLTDANGNLTTEPIENIILMIPFTSLLLWALKDKVLKKFTMPHMVWTGLKFGFLFSVTIETLQLFLRLGTVQFADIFYNTLGGTIGGLIYYLCIKLKKNDKRAKDKELITKRSTPMNLSTIHHIAIIVSDIHAAKDFYVNKLGFPIIRENHRPKRDDWKIDLRLNDTTELEIFVVSNPPKRVSHPEACGLRHLAFKVESVDEMVKELGAVGIMCEPVRLDTYTEKKMTFFHDPDGLPIEIHE